MEQLDFQEADLLPNLMANTNSKQEKPGQKSRDLCFRLFFTVTDFNDIFIIVCLLCVDCSAQQGDHENHCTSETLE